ncbi:MAG: serine hydrolase [Bacteroidetes bacterium]|nr:serine hydrolase [Bacteroidota bacterium]MCY4233351.1 serine hydrolase [Bacteroidota bacterium]
MRPLLKTLPVLVVGSLILSACRTSPPTPESEFLKFPMIQSSEMGLSDSVIVNHDALANIDSILIRYILAEAFPGAAVALGKRSDIVKITGYGSHTYRSLQKIYAESVFDVASLTKVIATTTAVMLLFDQGKLNLDTPVSNYLEEFDSPERNAITIQHLLSHSSGLSGWRPLHLDGVYSRESLIDSILTMPLIAEPGKTSQYSSYGMIILGLIIEKITQTRFGDWCNEHIFQPLGMQSTGFLSTGKTDSTVVPTEIDTSFRHRLIQGEVHDENAWILGGVAGHAGLFSTATDLSKFATMMVQRGLYNGHQFVQPETVDYFTNVVDSTISNRALGWDTRGSSLEESSAGQYFGPRSYGHTGFTGTSLWIDPDTQAWIILLTNRVYPSRDHYDRFQGVRGLVADATYKALIDSHTKSEHFPP